MERLITVLVLVLSITMLLAFGGHAANRCSTLDDVIIYEHPYYSGNTLRVVPGSAISDLREKWRGSLDDWNDAISSVQIPNGLKVTFYRDKNFTGPFISLNQNTNQLFSIGWDNIPSSMRVDVVSSCGTNAYAIFYERPNFKGRSFTLYPGNRINNLRNKKRGTGHWNDRIQSVLIVNNAVVYLYEDRNYSGTRLSLTQSAGDLSTYDFGWDNIASSVTLSSE